MTPETNEMLRDLALRIDEKIASPATPKGRAAYVKSLTAWAKSAATVAKSYKDKLDEMGDLGGSMSGATLLANVEKLLTSVAGELTQVSELAGKMAPADAGTPKKKKK